MEPKDREVFFLRNTDADVLKAELLSLGYEGDIDAAIKGIREKVENRLSKLSTAAQALYLPAGNEARIKAVYEKTTPLLHAGHIMVQTLMLHSTSVPIHRAICTTCSANL